MKIGLDVRPLQMHHRFRGIGMHMMKLIELLPKNANSNDSFVFYEYEGMPDWKEHVKIPKSLNYVTIKLPQTGFTQKKVPYFIKEALHNYRRVTRPLQKGAISKCDVFVTFDFMHGLPSKGLVPIITVGYDLIPLIFPKDYFPNLFVAWRRSNFNEAIRDNVVKYLYKWAAKQTVKRSAYILTISNSTKDQFVKVVPRSSDKMHTVYLGGPPKPMVKEELQNRFPHIKTPYILYVGGGDPRRRIDHLVKAFESLKDTYPSLSLVLAGNDFKSVESIPTKKTRAAINESSALSSITFSGFISEEDKLLLYRNALCFVYPTLSEGFGLPILEAMQESCPVISYDYKYSSVAEIAGKAALVGRPGVDFLKQSIEKILTNKTFTKRLTESGLANVERFSWNNNAQETYQYIARAISSRSNE